MKQPFGLRKSPFKLPKNSFLKLLSLSCVDGDDFDPPLSLADRLPILLIDNMHIESGKESDVIFVTKDFDFTSCHWDLFVPCPFCSSKDGRSVEQHKKHL